MDLQEPWSLSYQTLHLARGTCPDACLDHPVWHFLLGVFGVTHGWDVSNDGSTWNLPHSAHWGEMEPVRRFGDMTMLVYMIRMPCIDAFE